MNVKLCLLNQEMKKFYVKELATRDVILLLFCF